MATENNNDQENPNIKGDSDHSGSSKSSAVHHDTPSQSVSSTSVASASAHDQATEQKQHQQQSLDFLSRPVKTWSVDEVGAWIGSLGAKFVKYAPEFKELGVDGRTLLMLEKTALESMLQNPIEFGVFWSKLEQIKKRDAELLSSNNQVLIQYFFIFIFFNLFSKIKLISRIWFVM